MSYVKGLNPEFWMKVRYDEAYAGHRADLKERWERFCTSPLEALPYHLFKRFYTDGNRRAYENYYFARRQSANVSALMALLYPEEQTYLERLQECLFAICNEYTWVLPAHQKELETYNPVHIDLFAAETALNLSEIYVLLEKRLDPFILRRVKEEIRRRILDPYKSKTFFWETMTNNWAIVCTGGVAIALMNLFPEEAVKLISRFEEAAESFLSGYGEDGFCPEGPMYWGYGFGFFTAYAERLRQFAGMDHFQRRKIRRIASFFQKKYLSDAAEVTFADADMGTPYNLGILHFLHKEYPQDVVVPPISYAAFSDRCARMCFHLRAFLWFDPEVETGSGSGSHYGSDVQWLIVQKENYGFAAKAGHNGESHNHNDIGSFIFAKNGRQIFTDPGRGEYCRDYFGEKRYDFFHTSSKGHSVPVVGGAFQKDGREYAANEVLWDGTAFSMELSGAYGMSGIKSLKREFVLLEDGIKIQDRFDSEEEIVERFVVTEKPQEENGCFRWSDTVMWFPKGWKTAIERREFLVEEGKTQELYLIDLIPEEKIREFTCIITGE